MEPTVLVRAWDNHEPTREQLRTYGRLLLLPSPGNDSEPIIPDVSAVIPKSVAVARFNAAVLLPVLDMISVETGLKLPCIDMLMEAVEGCYDKTQQDVPTTRVYQDAWGIRRLVQLVKARLYKKTPPTDPSLMIFW